MEIHKPHAAKTWKEFFIELGTVVLGILIALSLEQAVENWREHRQYLEARDAMRFELAGNLASIAPRGVISACNQKRLAEISTLLDKAEARQAFDPPRWVGEAASSRIRFVAESEASRSGLFRPAEQRTLSRFYSFLHSIDAEMDRERQAWARLLPLEGRTRLPPEMIADLRQAQAQARYEDERITFLMSFINTLADELSLTATPISPEFWPTDWPSCLPMNTPRQEALRRIAYPSKPLP